MNIFLHLALSWALSLNKPESYISYLTSRGLNLPDVVVMIFVILLSDLNHDKLI